MTDHDDQKRMIKEAFKEAVKEWLDGQYKKVGKWSVRGFIALLLAAFVVLILWANGHLAVHLVDTQTQNLPPISH